MIWHRWVQRGLLGLSFLLSAFLLYLLLARTEPAPTLTPEPLGTLGRADAGIDQFTFVQSQAGAVQWEIQAQRAQMFEADNRAVLEDVQVTLYGQDGWQLKLDGDEGTVDMARKNFLVAKRESPIAVQLESGYTIFTNHLVWANERREITTNDPVTISGNGVDVTGRGLIGKLDHEEFQVLENVRVEIAP